VKAGVVVVVIAVVVGTAVRQHPVVPAEAALMQVDKAPAQVPAAALAAEAAQMMVQAIRADEGLMMALATCVVGMEPMTVLVMCAVDMARTMVQRTNKTGKTDFNTAPLSKHKLDGAVIAHEHCKTSTTHAQTVAKIYTQDTEQENPRASIIFCVNF
jgi:hypothetical protein